MSLSELQEKEHRVRAMMAENGLDALLIRGVSNFAWLTGGATNYVSIAAAEGNSWLLFTPEAKYIIANNIEATRLQAEENLTAQGCQFQIIPWHESDDVVARLTRGLRLGTDSFYSGAVNVSAELAKWRVLLLREERALFKQVAAWCGEAIQAAARQVRPGITEQEIAGLLAREAYARGLTPVVLLVAVDERVWQFRHPLPTAKVMQHYAMLVLGGRHRGLVGSVTRLVHYGPLSEELQRKQMAVARVDATLIAATRPGARVAEVFRRAIDTYAAVGYLDEWRYHHQGGATGYEPREYRATANSMEIVQLGQAFAWNPSIAGVKSEDTIVVEESGNEIASAVGGWPTISVPVDGQIIERPAILEVL